VHELNTTIPTTSFAAGVDVTGKCRDLFDMVSLSGFGVKV